MPIASSGLPIAGTSVSRETVLGFITFTSQSTSHRLSMRALRSQRTSLAMSSASPRFRIDSGSTAPGVGFDLEMSGEIDG